MMKRVVVLVVTLLVLLACSACAKPECRRAVRELEREVAKLPSRCTEDADCTCYNGGVRDVTNCGGVSERATASRMNALTDELRKARCSPSVACAASVCSARCVSGVCSP